MALYAEADGWTVGWSHIFFVALSVFPLSLCFHFPCVFGTAEEELDSWTFNPRQVITVSSPFETVDGERPESS